MYIICIKIKTIYALKAMYSTVSFPIQTYSNCYHLQTLFHNRHANILKYGVFKSFVLHIFGWKFSSSCDSSMMSTTKVIHFLTCKETPP
jgi:hypothetical protein